MKEKNITKTYRNGASIFLLPCIIRLRSNIVGDKFSVTEQRVGFKDEKILFYGAELAANEIFTNTNDVTSVAKAKSHFAWL